MHKPRLLHRDVKLSFRKTRGPAPQFICLPEPKILTRKATSPMADNVALLADTPPPVSVGTIDLAKYRTADLAERLTELISVPQAFRKILTTTCILAVLSTVACYLAHVHSEITLTPLLCISAYSLATGVIFGLVLGVLRILATALQNIESILKIVLEITGMAAMEYEQIQEGTIRLPSGGELAEEVYEGVVLPVMERAVASAFGVLGAPLLWTYRRTAGSAVRYLIKRVSRTKITANDGQAFAQNANSGLAAVAKYSETAKAFTSRASEFVGNIGRKIRLYTILPIYILFLASLAIAAVPILVTRYFTTG